MTDLLQNHDQDPAAIEGALPDAAPDDEELLEGEFRLTVRKLELPVRPRGVLAE